MGCSISFLRHIVFKARMLLKKYLGRMAHDDSLTNSENMTSQDLCRLLVIPETKDKQCTLYDQRRHMMDDNGQPCFGRANVFISHAWACKTADVLDVAEQYEAEHPGSYYWYDIVMINQNLVAEVPEDWWSTTFMDLIKDIGTVLLLLSPWNDPIVVKRAWCLWEIMCALSQEGVVLDALLPRTEPRRDCRMVCSKTPSLSCKRLLISRLRRLGLTRIARS